MDSQNSMAQQTTTIYNSAYQEKLLPKEIFPPELLKEYPLVDQDAGYYTSQGEF